MVPNTQRVKHQNLHLVSHDFNLPLKIAEHLRLETLTNKHILQKYMIHNHLNCIPRLQLWLLVIILLVSIF